MRCKKHDAHMTARREWVEDVCEDPDCPLCSGRPESPQDCPLGPCESCSSLDTLMGNKRLRGIAKMINTDARTRDLLYAEVRKSENDSHKRMLVVQCRHTNETVFVADARPSDEPRPAGARGPNPSKRATCWLADYLQDLPEDPAAPSRRAVQEAARQRAEEYWSRKRLWRLP